jgi:hypothetical protein
MQSVYFPAMDATGMYETQLLSVLFKHAQSLLRRGQTRTQYLPFLAVSVSPPRPLDPDSSHYLVH